MKVGVEGRLTTGSYEKDGQKVYTTDVIVNSHTFCEKKVETPEKAIEAEIPENLPFK
jgi:single-strand DNA-binding protein